MTDNGPKPASTDLLRLHFGLRLEDGHRSMQLLQKLSWDVLSQNERAELVNSIDVLNALVASLAHKYKLTTNDLLSTYKKALQDGTIT